MNKSFKKRRRNGLPQTIILSDPFIKVRSVNWLNSSSSLALWRASKTHLEIFAGVMKPHHGVGRDAPRDAPLQPQMMNKLFIAKSS